MRAAPYGRLVVLQSVPDPKPTTNPYLVQLIRSLRASGVEVLTFSWRQALLGRYDLLHMHWPEILCRGNGRVRTLARQLALVVLVGRLAFTRTPIVRTLHNPTRHERTSLREDLLMQLVDRCTTCAIAISAKTAPLPGRPMVTIPHGHYRDHYSRFVLPESRRGRLAYVGLIRPYKGTEELISAFRGLPGGGRSLTVSGSPRTPELAAELTERAAGDNRITLELRYLSDAELVTRIGEAELVVLPYRDLHNSGVALAALSLGRPVLVPANEVTTDLAAEVGQGWVFSYAGELTSDALMAGLQALDATCRSAEPNLSRREWSTAGEAHMAAYTMALRLRRPSRRHTRCRRDPSRKTTASAS
jgi:beta-1,4-mannosyltransferase